MRLALRPRFFVLLVTAVALSGCDDEEPVTEITVEQAELLTVTVWEQAYRVGGSIPVGFGQAGSPPVAAQTMEFQDETTVSCELSGSVTVGTTAFLEEEGDGGTISIVGVQTHDGCTFQVDGTTFTLEGAPAITTAWDFSGDGAGSVVYDGSMTGGVEVSTDTGGGFCAFDVDWGGSSSSTAGTVSFELSGTVCGRPVSRSLTVNATT
jgi:hypothetical protein